jgi:hypothetical protein
VLTNDTDLDGDSLSIVAFTQPEHSSVVYNGDGTFTYIPGAGYVGEDSFTYTVGDGAGGTDTATIFVTIYPVNHPPIATDDVVATQEDTAAIVNVLANDTDVDGDPLTVTAFTQPGHGHLLDNGGGSFTYQPDAGYTGSDGFSYTISDSAGGTDSGGVTITVVPSEQPAVELNIESVGSSDYESPNAPGNTIDENLTTRWSSYGDGQWIEYDLGSGKLVSEVYIAWHVGARRTATFDVQVSSDGTSWTTGYSGQSSGTTTQLEEYGLGNLTGRYVRIVGHGNSESNWNSITEVEIWGSSLVSQGVRGDLTGDGTVGQADLDIVLDKWGQKVSLGDPSDPNGDGIVTQTDLDIILCSWCLPATTDPTSTTQLMVPTAVVADSARTELRAIPAGTQAAGSVGAGEASDLEGPGLTSVLGDTLQKDDPLILIG